MSISGHLLALTKMAENPELQKISIRKTPGWDRCA